MDSLIQRYEDLLVRHRSRLLLKFYEQAGALMHGYDMPAVVRGKNRISNIMQLKIFEMVGATDPGDMDEESFQKVIQQHQPMSANAFFEAWSEVFAKAADVELGQLEARGSAAIEIKDFKVKDIQDPQAQEAMVDMLKLVSFQCTACAMLIGIQEECYQNIRKEWGKRPMPPEGWDSTCEERVDERIKASLLTTGGGR